MPQRIVDVTEVVHIQMPQCEAAPVVFGQAYGQQGLEALAVGDTGQRVLFGQALQGVFKYAALTHMAQTTSQYIRGQTGPDQPVADVRGRNLRLSVQQQDGGQAATTRRRLQGARRQEQCVAIVLKQVTHGLPAGCAQQND